MFNVRSFIMIFFTLLSATFLMVSSVSAKDTQSNLSLPEEDFVRNVTVADPIQPYNRFITSVNDRLYLYALEPSSEFYSMVVPEEPRTSFDNFFNNIKFPIRFINNILQLKLDKAGVELLRFVVNSTIGLVGFNDPAEECFKLKPYREDTGQTLGFYNIGPIFHIDWPFIGQSNLRDSVGFVSDIFLNPITYIPNMWIVVGLNVFEKINKNTFYIGEYEKMKAESLDYYLYFRDLYEQYRAEDIVR